MHQTRGGSPSSFAQYEGPANAIELWDQLREYTDKSINGVYIQRVKEEISDGNGGWIVDPTGATRLIVYLGGTTSDWWGNQGILENVPASWGLPKQDQIDAINEAIADSPDEISEIMLVGYSQGGIDAQNLAFSPFSLMNWDNSLVTSVVTFASPIMTGAPSRVETIHLQAWYDPVPNLFNNPLLATQADFTGDRFYAESTVPATDPNYVPPNTGNTILDAAEAAKHEAHYLLFDFHGGSSVYHDIATQFVENSEGKYAHAKVRIGHFIGKVVDAYYIPKV